MLISILLPSLQKAREIRVAPHCGANMGGFGRGALTYAEANKGMLPSPEHDPKATRPVGPGSAGRRPSSATTASVMTRRTRPTRKTPSTKE